MGLTLTVTNAGRAALVNASNTGTAPVTIAQVGLTGTAVTPDPGATALPGEFKRIVTLSGDVVADDTIHLIVRDETGDVFTVRSLALYLGDGTLFAIYGQADVLVEKSAQALMLLAIDVQFADVDATDLTFGDANFLNPPATTEQMGVVELSTLAEAIGGTSASRVPAEKMVKDAVNAWLDARFGANNAGIWHPGNDGAGSGLDADLLNGQQGSWYSNIPARLGYNPVQQGTGNGQLAGNVIKIGWSAASRLKATVDVTDQGNLVTDPYLAGGGLGINGAYMNRAGNALWGPDNDGAGSGLDADLLDGQQGSAFAKLAVSNTFTAGNTFSGQNTFSTLQSFTGTDLMAGIALQNPTGGRDWRVLQKDNGKFYITDETAGAARFIIDASGSVTAGSNILWHAGNDGSGSGLDADLLDGQHGSYYSNITARLGYTPINKAGDDVSGTLNFTNNSTLIKVSGLEAAWSNGTRLNLGQGLSGDVQIKGNAAWHSGNDGAGSGLDADLLDGVQGADYARISQDNTFAGMATIAKAGNEQIRIGYGTGAARSPQITLYDGLIDRLGFLQAVSDRLRIYRDGGGELTIYGAGDLRMDGSKVWHAGNDGSGSGLDADLLDGQHASAFAKMADFAGDLSAGGYQKLPGGLVLQWVRGASGASEGSQALNWPLTFTAVIDAFVSTSVSFASSSADVWFQLVGSPSNNGCTVMRGYSGNTGEVAAAPVVFALGRI